MTIAFLWFPRRDRRGRCRLGGVGACLAISLALATSACQRSSHEAAAPSAPLPASPAVVSVTMLDHRYDYDAAVPAGRVVFRFENAGHANHDVDLLPLGDDFPPIQEQVRGSLRRAVTPFAALRERRPGTTGTFAVDLRPGRRYALVCSLVDSDGQSHASKGMASEFRTPPVTTSPDGPAATTASDATSGEGR